jgi:opacity protein-like surface antigen
MKQTINLKSCLIVAALSLGAALSASAQATPPAAPAAESSGGMLGSRYSQAEYTYLDFTGAGPTHADGFRLAFNQPLQAGFDLNLGYDWARASYAGARATQQDLDLGATAFTTLSWGRPYVAASAGWSWVKAAGVSDDSFRYKVGVGVEFPAATSLVVTPFVNFVRATGFNASEVDLGVKAAYRLTREWSITATAQYDAVIHDNNAAEYSLGVAYHF